MRLRPARNSDHAAVLSLAKEAGFGMTSLPPDADVLAEKIEASVRSFEGRNEKRGQETFFFVLEDPEKDNLIAGTCGIKAHVGLSQPFYSYKLTTITQASQQLDVFSKHTILQVTNDLTGHTEIGSLFLSPAYRRDRIGKMLSLSRFMFMAAFGQYFDDVVLAEMRGVHDAKGNAPFYNAVARHFFQMPFAEADYINATQGNQFINDLMPKYPIYLELLPKTAQAVVGQVNPASEPAKFMLQRQGFKPSGYIDIFDAGPTLLAEREQIRTIRESEMVKVTGIQNMEEDVTKYLVSNERFADFHVTLGRMKPDAGGMLISPKLADRLNVSVGDMIRHAPI